MEPGKRLREASLDGATRRPRRLSVKALDTYWQQLTTMYGTRGLVGQWICTTEAGALSALSGAQLPNVDALVDAVLAAASFEGRDGAGAARP